MESFFKTIALALVAFLLPIVPLLLIIGFTILVDTIFGIIASKKCNEPILSNKLARVFLVSITFSFLLHKNSKIFLDSLTSISLLSLIS